MRLKIRLPIAYLPFNFRNLPTSPGEVKVENQSSRESAAVLPFCGAAVEA
jgi:hypothetical protein